MVYATLKCGPGPDLQEGHGDRDRQPNRRAQPVKPVNAVDDAPGERHAACCCRAPSGVQEHSADIQVVVGIVTWSPAQHERPCGYGYRCVPLAIRTASPCTSLAPPTSGPTALPMTARLRTSDHPAFTMGE